jgi:hypothetical protein
MTEYVPTEDGGPIAYDRAGSGDREGAFMVDATESLVRALPRAERAEVPGSGHRWEPADLADRLAAYLPVSGPGASRSS